MDIKLIIFLAVFVGAGLIFATVYVASWLFSREKDWVIEKQGFVEATGNTLRGSFDYTTRAVIERNKKDNSRRAYIYSPGGMRTVELPVSEIEAQMRQ